MEFKQTLNLPYEFVTADEIMLKTIIRTNPGLMLMKEGTILDKWRFKDIPDFENKKLYAGILTRYREKTEFARSALFFMILATLIIIVLKF